MPFEISPGFKVKTGEFQDVADAILRGCAVTEPTSGNAVDRDLDGNILRTCVWSAYFVGIGKEASCDARWLEATVAYGKRHKSCPISDFIEHRFTREEIAARIAAL